MRFPRLPPQTRAFLAATALCLGAFLFLRLAFFAATRNLYASAPAGEILGAFLRGARYDLHVTALLTGLPFLLLHLPGQWKRGALPAWILLWSPYPALLAGIFLGVADIPYYLEVGRHLSFEVSMVARGDKVSTLGMILGYKWWLLFFLLVAAPFTVGWRKAVSLFWQAPGEAPKKPDGAARETAWLAGALLFLLFSLHGSLGAGPLRASQAFPGGSIELGHLALSPLFTIEKAAELTDASDLFFMEKGKAVANLARLVSTPETRFLDPRYPLFRVNGPLRALPSFSATPNVVILLMESFSGAFVGALGGEPGVTPRFDALARDGLLFTNILSVGTRSPEGFAAVALGTPLFNHAGEQSAAAFDPPGAGHFRGVGSILGSRGYSSLFIRGAKRDSSGVGTLARRAGIARVAGLEDLSTRAGEEERFDWGIEDDRMAEILAGEIGSLPAPFLLTWLSLSSHSRHQVPERFRWFPEDDPNGGFKDTLRFADEALGRFFDLAREEPWFPDTLFVITADHTGGKIQGLPPLERHRVPLLFYAPGRVQPGRRETLGTQMDILPTLLDLAGVDEPHHAFGRSLLRAGGKEFAFVNLGQGYGWFQDGLFLTLDPGGKGVSARDAATGDPLAGEAPRGPRDDFLSFVQGALDLLGRERLAP